MPFKPHPIQVQALRIAKRFQLGFRPTKVGGKPLASNSVLTRVKFGEVPAFVLSAELDRVPNREELIDELCQRGYLLRHDGYPRCSFAPMEYMTEDGARVFVHNEHWGQIDVLPRNAKFFRRQVGGFSGQVRISVPTSALPNAKQRKRSVPAATKAAVRGKKPVGSCYELRPAGFALLDENEERPVIVTSKRAVEMFAVGRTTLRRYVSDKKLTDYRKTGSPKNSPLQLSVAELDTHFARLAT